MTLLEFFLIFPLMLAMLFLALAAAAIIPMVGHLLVELLDAWRGQHKRSK